MSILRTLAWVAVAPIAFFVLLPQLLFLATRTEFATIAPENALVFITGCSSGLGREYVRSAIAQGYNVVASVRKEADAVDLRKEFEGKRVKTILLDITAEDQRTAAVESFVSTAEEWKVQPYALINNAGAGGFGPMEGKTIEDTRWAMEVHYHSPIRLANLVRPIFAEKGAGRILFVGSTVDRMGMSMTGVYASAKAALHTVALAMRNEWVFQGIAVTYVYQGPATTKYMSTNLQDTTCSSGVEDKAHGKKYCEWQAVNMKDEDFMPSSDAPHFFMFDAVPQAEVAIDHLSTPYPLPDLLTNIPGRAMVLAMQLPEWLREHMFRVR